MCRLGLLNMLIGSHAEHKRAYVIPIAVRVSVCPAVHKTLTLALILSFVAVWLSYWQCWFQVVKKTHFGLKIQVFGSKVKKFNIGFNSFICCCMAFILTVLVPGSKEDTFWVKNSGFCYILTVLVPGCQQSEVFKIKSWKPMEIWTLAMLILSYLVVQHTYWQDWAHICEPWWFYRSSFYIVQRSIHWMFMFQLL